MIVDGKTNIRKRKAGATELAKQHLQRRCKPALLFFHKPIGCHIGLTQNVNFKENRNTDYFAIVLALPWLRYGVPMKFLWSSLDL